MSVNVQGIYLVKYPSAIIIDFNLLAHLVDHMSSVAFVIYPQATRRLVHQNSMYPINKKA